MADSHHDISKHVRTYIGIFIALLVGTVITVGLYYVHFHSIALTIAVALVIATIKSSLVAGFFMHLISEKKTIYSIMAVAGFFFLALMALFILSLFDTPTPKGL